MGGELSTRERDSTGRAATTLSNVVTSTPGAGAMSLRAVPATTSRAGAKWVPQSCVPVNIAPGTEGWHASAAAVRVGGHSRRHPPPARGPASQNISTNVATTRRGTMKVYVAREFPLFARATYTFVLARER
jgi:hypothetical protein